MGDFFSKSAEEPSATAKKSKPADFSGKPVERPVEKSVEKSV